jgi:hypothetical protein
MNNRTPFVWSSAVVTLALGASAWVACYAQEAARSARQAIMQDRDNGAPTEQLVIAPVVVRLPAVDR